MVRFAWFTCIVVEASEGVGVAELPSGTVTFLFTDLVVSTRLWEQEPDSMRTALARHDELLRSAIESHGGFVVKGRGDGVHAVFATADAAVLAAIDCQFAMDAESWSVSEPLRVRVGIHTGVAELRDGDYFGSAVNRAARLEAIAHGGQVVCSQASADLARDTLPEAVELIDLGEHTLRDLARPERVFQVAHPDLSQDFARLLTADAVAGNLPTRASSFVGREPDLERIAAALETSPMVTLTGVGGVGKTRLAVQVAVDVLPRFADGAWLCELAPVRDPDAVVDAVAGVFRVSARPGSTMEQSLVGFLRDQQLLVVLDNCEHVLRPAATLAAAIVGECPGVRILATSREGLNVAGEQILVVPSLTVPDEGSDLVGLERCEAVRLFVDRAQAVKAGFVVEAGNTEAVAQVCRRLDGVPLAIELAAARVNAMSPAELARRLDQRFRLLSGGDRVAIERHQTLRATIDWSYDLLSEPEQRLLVRLAVFAGGFTLDSAEAVCSGGPIDADRVVDLLVRLVSHHLVVADDAGDATRYRLLETIRQYGEERLAEHSETDALRTRHCDHYTDFARTVSEGVFGPRQLDCAARLAREHANLVTAMAFALATADLERAMRLRCEVPPFWAQTDDPVLFDPTLVLALPSAIEHPGSARAIWDAYLGGRYALVREFAERVLAANEGELRACPGSVPLSFLLPLVRAALAESSGRLAEGSAFRREAAEHAVADGYLGLGATEFSMCAFGFSWFDLPAAAAAATEGLVLARRSGMPTAIASNLLILARALAPSDPERAAALLHEAEGFAHGTWHALYFATVVAGLLGDWPMTMRTAQGLFEMDRRSAVTAPVLLAMVVGLIARGLEDSRPEQAAVLHGAARSVMLASEFEDASGERGAGAAGSWLLVQALSQDFVASAALVDALGTEQFEALRAEGEAMDRDEASAYARHEIAGYLATIGEDT